MRAVLFDLDQTLHDRAASIALYIAGHHGRLGFSHIALETYRAKFVALDRGGYTEKDALFAELVRHFELPVEAGRCYSTSGSVWACTVSSFPMHSTHCERCESAAFSWAS